MKPSKRLIQEIRALIRLSLFLKEVGLKQDLSSKELKTLLHALRQTKNV